MTRSSSYDGFTTSAIGIGNTLPFTVCGQETRGLISYCYTLHVACSVKEVGIGLSSPIRQLFRNGCECWWSVLAMQIYGLLKFKQIQLYVVYTLYSKYIARLGSALQWLTRFDSAIMSLNRV